MKTTIDLPDDLLIEAKKRAIERRTSLKALIVNGLQRELGLKKPGPGETVAIDWVTVDGGVPDGLDVSDRAKMMDWLQHDRT